MANPSMKEDSEEKQQLPWWESVKDTDYQHFELHSKLIDALHATVIAKVEEIKKNASAGNNMGLEGGPSPKHSRTKRRRAASSSASYRSSKNDQLVTSVVIKDKVVSFECPQQFTAHDVDMDLAASCYRTVLEQDGVAKEVKPIQFSFRERLENWTIQCRRRPHGRVDMFYRFPREKRSFRSVIEVVHFILYEICPNAYKQGLPQDQGNNEGGDPAASERPKKRRRSTYYRGGRRRKHRRTKGKAQEKAEEEEKAATDHQEDVAAAAAVNEEEAEEDAAAENEEAATNPSQPPPPEPQTQEEAPTYTDLLNISEDLSAYESLFDKCFDGF